MKDIWVGLISALALGVLIWGSPFFVNEPAPSHSSFDARPALPKDTLERVEDPPDSPAPTVASVPRQNAKNREPVLLLLPTRGVRSQVTSVALDSAGGVTVPDDVSVTGWYDGSKRLDARRGTTVIVGHRDARTQGPGALFGIEGLALGDEIQVVGRDGDIRTFAVNQVELIHKDDLPQRAPEVFTRDGSYSLTLITCGGDFDETERSYLYNVVVTANPVAINN